MVLFFLLSLPVAALGQLSLPSPSFNPPDPSAGASPSSSGLPNAQWSTLLGDALWFYEAQRSGKLPDSKRVSWRNDSALADSPQGGYYDAGDYVKFTYPLTYVLSSVCWGAIDFGKGYDDAKQTAYLDSMLRWGLDWLIQAHPDNNTLIVQTGDTAIDNNYWGGDQNIPLPRPSFQINSTHPGTDAAALASAAFSACSLLYANRTLYTSNAVSAPASLTDLAYSTTLLGHAQALYSFANTATPQQTYQTAVPQSASSYASSSYADDLIFAGLFLAAATNSSDTYSTAQSLFKSSSLAGYDGTLNWDSKVPALPVLGLQVAQALAPNSANEWQTEAERYLDNIVNNKGKGHLTKGGLLYYPGDSDEASLNPALNIAMLMRHYAPLASSSDKSASYKSFAQSQVNYALGKNPMSMPYVVGVNPNSPTNPHTAIASGGNDITNIDHNPETEAYVLYGAVVGGPNENDQYYDIRSDWPEAEVALDYNAPLLTLISASIIDTPNDPFYTSLQAGAYAANKPKGTPCDPAFPCRSGLSKAAKIAIGVVVSVVGLVIIGAVWYIIRRR